VVEGHTPRLASGKSSLILSFKKELLAFLLVLAWAETVGCEQHPTVRVEAHCAAFANVAGAALRSVFGVAGSV